MPGMDGMELYRYIEARWPALARCMVFMTGDSLSAANLAGLDRPCIEKPFSPEKVYGAIAQVCRETPSG